MINNELDIIDIKLEQVLMHPIYSKLYLNFLFMEKLAYGQMKNNLLGQLRYNSTTGVTYRI